MAHAGILDVECIPGRLQYYRRVATWPETYKYVMLLHHAKISCDKSAYISMRCLAYLGEVGFVGSVCTDPLTTYLAEGEGLWVWVFIYSKIPELLDTFFQV